MLTGVDYVTTRRGTVVKITWTAPEVGVDITAEEHQRRINDFAQTWLNIVAEECQKLLNEGKPEAAEARWKKANIPFPPFWLKE